MQALTYLPKYLWHNHIMGRKFVDLDPGYGDFL